MQGNAFIGYVAFERNITLFEFVVVKRHGLASSSVKTHSFSPVAIRLVPYKALFCDRVSGCALRLN